MSDFVNLLQEFAMGVLSAVLPILSVAIIAAVKVLIDKWLADIAASKPQFAAVLAQAVEIAVGAAEQANLAGFVEEKKQYALNIAQAFLNEHGWDEFDLDVLEAAIEAEVLKQFPK